MPMKLKELRSVKIRVQVLVLGGMFIVPVMALAWIMIMSGGVDHHLKLAFMCIAALATLMFYPPTERIIIRALDFFIFKGWEKKILE